MQRRPLFAAILSSSLAVSGKLSAAPAASAQRFDPKRTLVVFYSRRGENYAPGGTEVLAVGHTELLARRIAERFGTRLFEIETVDPYPESYDETTRVVRRQIEGRERPAIVGPLPDLADVELVVLGHPIWWGRMPPALNTFLETVDLSGKTVAHFCTHAGSGFGSSHADLARAEPRATLFEGPDVTGVDAEREAPEVVAWAGGFIRS